MLGWLRQATETGQARGERGLPPARVLEARLSVTYERHGDPAAATALYRALLGATLLLPIRDSAGGDAGGAGGAGGAETEVETLPEKRPDGQQLVALFTTEETLRRWRPGGCASIPLVASEAFIGALEDGTSAGAVLNPAGPIRCELSRPVMRQLVSGQIPSAPPPCIPASERIPGQEGPRSGGGAIVTVGRDGVAVLDRVPFPLPLGEVPPPLTLGRIRRLLEVRPAITAAYLYRTEPDGGAPQLTVGLILASGGPTGASAAAGGGDWSLFLIQMAAELHAARQEDPVAFVALDSDSHLDAVRSVGAPYMVTVLSDLEQQTMRAARMLSGGAPGDDRSHSEDPVLWRRFTESAQLKLR